MKRYFIVIFCLLLLVSCGGQKTTQTEEEVPADTTVGTADTTAVDSVDVLSNLPMPKAADELFDDFIFNFADELYSSISFLFSFAIHYFIKR